MKNPVEQLYRYRELSRRTLKRGKRPTDQQPTTQRPKQTDAWVIIVGCLVFGACGGAALGAIRDHTLISALENMVLWAFLAAGGYAIFPLLVGIQLAIKQRECPDSGFLKQFRFGHVVFCLMTVAALLALLSLPSLK